MSDAQPTGRALLTLPEAAAYLSLPTEAVRALVEAAFLQPAGHGPAGPLLDRAELRAFMTWNLGRGDEEEVTIDMTAGSGDPDALLGALDGRSEEMAGEAFEIFADVFPEARLWSAEDQARFVEQARGRFEAILAVTAHGVDLDEALAGDLKSVGAAAAKDGAPLPQLLVVLRISRDLVVQTAIEVADERGRQWGLALSLLLHRVLPAMDRLTDSLAQGYWSAVIGRQKEARARYEHVVEHSSDGVYEVDLEGRIQYANPQLGVILGRRRLDELEGSLLGEVMEPREGGPAPSVLLHPSGGPRHLEMAITRPDGIRRVVDVRTMARLADGQLVGFQGVVRDITASRDLQAEKDRALTALLDELRRSLVLIADLGTGLAAGDGPPPEERSRQAGRSVADHAQRLWSLLDDVSKARRSAQQEPVLPPRPVELADVVHAALIGVDAAERRVDVQVPAGLTVMADVEGLQRVLRALVENAVQNGRAPVRLEVEGVASGELQLAVCGADCDPEEPAWEDGELALARTLLEAMGGRVWRDNGSGAAACFRLTVPVPNRRQGDEAIRL